MTHVYIYICAFVQKCFFGIIILHRNRKACRIIQHHIEVTSTDPNMNWHEEFMLPCQSKSKIIYTTMFFLCFQTMSRENGDNCTSFSPNHRKPWTGIVTLDMPRAESWWSWSSFPNHSWNGGATCFGAPSAKSWSAREARMPHVLHPQYSMWQCVRCIPCVKSPQACWARDL